MKKHLIALALGITTALSAILIMPAYALDPPMLGDVNSDWTVNIADLVCLQRYLLGSGELDMIYGIYSADVNSDNRIDVFDYIEMRKMVESQSNKITYQFTQVNTSIPAGVQYGRPSGSSAVIQSVEELEQYLAPCEVFLTNGECTYINAASQKVIDDLLARYDEDFFLKNALLLNYLRGTSGYEFKSIQYENSKFVIKYYDATPYGLTWNEPLPPYIAEVSVPKTLWTNGDVIWEEVGRPLEMTIKTDFTNEITDSAITSSFSKPSVITSSEELDTYINDKFHTGVKMSLKDTYNEEFFENNVLILDLYYQDYRQDWVTSLSVTKDKYNNIILTYDCTLVDGGINYGMQINQVVIPKEQYHFTDVLKEKTWETPVDILHNEFDLYQISEMIDNADAVMVNQYSFGNKNVADIYRLHLGGGSVQFSGYDYIGTVEFKYGYLPINDSEYISYAEGEKIVMETDEYKITLESINIPKNVKQIPDEAFMSCMSLNNITIPSSVISIGVRAFYSCRKFTEITIPTSVESLGEMAFADCQGLTKVNISTKINKLESAVFGNCNSLTELTIPENITFISKDALPTHIKNLTILSSECELEDGLYMYITKECVITAPQGSPAQEFAEAYGLEYKELFISGVPAMGDVNNDGLFSTADTVMMQKYLLDAGELTARESGDMNRDSRLDIYDFILMRQELKNSPELNPPHVPENPDPNLDYTAKNLTVNIQSNEI